MIKINLLPSRYFCTVQHFPFNLFCILVVHLPFFHIYLIWFDFHCLHFIRSLHPLSLFPGQIWIVQISSFRTLNQLFTIFYQLSNLGTWSKIPPFLTHDHTTTITTYNHLLSASWHMLNHVKRIFKKPTKRYKYSIWQKYFNKQTVYCEKKFSELN